MRKKENEGPWLDYERYALGKCLKRLVEKYKIKTVLEMPAHGVKAMPSLYSLSFGQAGCHVVLVNADEEAKKAWRELGYDVAFVEADDLHNTGFKDNSFDFVWSFAYLPNEKNKDAYINEMIRVSKRLVSVFCVNGYNPGFLLHRLAHKIHSIDWTHGDQAFSFPNNLKQLFIKCGLGIAELGVVNTPPWPDSVGFRDIRLHKLGTTGKINWHSGTLDFIENNNVPNWIKLIYKFERLPVPLPLKLIYAHIYYLIGQKRGAVD